VSTAFGDDERAALLRMARCAIVDRLCGTRTLDRELETTPPAPALEEPAACFVTLTEPAPGGRPRLRGCIGTLEAREPLYRAVIDAAVKSAFSDPRFPALSQPELETIRIEVSVLTACTRVSGPEAIRVGEDGVELERGSRRAVFLPKVAVEQGWDRGELLEQLALKAGLPRDGWRGAELSTFQAQAFAEPTREEGA